jgi:hypothetical protein
MLIGSHQQLVALLQAGHEKQGQPLLAALHLDVAHRSLMHDAFGAGDAHAQGQPYSQCKHAQPAAK